MAPSDEMISPPRKPWQEMLLKTQRKVADNEGRRRELRFHVVISARKISEPICCVCHAGKEISHSTTLTQTSSANLCGLRDGHSTAEGAGERRETCPLYGVEQTELDSTARMGYLFR